MNEPTRSNSDSQFGGLYALVQGIITDTKQHAILLAQVQRELQDQARELSGLARIMRDGNGRPSLLERMALVERALTLTTEGFAEIRKALEARNAEEMKGKWALMVTIASALIAAGSAISAAVITAMNR